MWLPVVLAFSGCSTTLKQSALDPKGPVSQMQYDVMMLTLYVVTGLFIVVGGAMAYTVWRYRLKKGEDPNAIPDQSHGNPLIEVGLIVLSASMLVIIGIPTLKGIAYMKNDPVEEYEGEAIEIIVTGYQWWWNFEYPELGIKTSNEFSIPTGRPVKLVLKAADVIHSFWVPKLAGKTDLIPGQINRMWIEADEPGMYWGQCAEFCGTRTPTCFSAPLHWNQRNSTHGWNIKNQPRLSRKAPSPTLEKRSLRKRAALAATWWAKSVDWQGQT